MKKIPSKILIFTIRIYQYAISPLLGANCRYMPTCSQYSIDAIKNHGFFKGFLLSVKRISSCHPWGGHGFDPVPPAKQKHGNEVDI